MDVIEMIRNAWSDNTNKMGGKFYLGKLYPVILRNNEKEVKVAIFKDSSAGPLKIKVLKHCKFGQYFQYYKIKGDNLEEIGEKNLWALTDDARAAQLKDFNDLFGS